MRMFELSDGSLVTSKQLAERVGCRLNTAYLRLKKSNDVDEVYKPLQKQQQRDMSSSGTPKKKIWIDKPVKIVMGIPINPSYMDGSRRHNNTVDRDGAKMSFTERTILERYRKEQRAEWLHSRGKRTDDEVDYLSREW